MNHTQIPTKLRAFVYLVGSLGFPIAITIYILVVVNTSIKQMEYKFDRLASLVNEKPLSLDKSSDLAIYIVQSLEFELKLGLPDFCEKVQLTSKNNEEDKGRQRKYWMLDIQSYIRPIVRKHQRFAERLPTVAGNLGRIFVLKMEGETKEAATIDTQYRDDRYKDFGEALSNIIIRNIDELEIKLNLEAGQDEVYTKIDRDSLQKIMSRAIERSCVGLRDNMLETLGAEANSNASEG